MKSAPLKELKSALEELGPVELRLIIHRLAKLKQENKDLLTYLLFESEDENQFIANVRGYIDESFDAIRSTSPYFARKTIRKILRRVNKLASFSDEEQTRVELLMYFLWKSRELNPSIRNSHYLKYLLVSQQNLIEKSISKMHPDLQYDYNKKLYDLGLFQKPD